MLAHASPPVYLDHNATSPLRPEVRAAMEPAFEGTFGNPSSVHAWGRAARRAVERARASLLAALDAPPGAGLVFTSGATEADQLALHGVMADAGSGARHLVVSAVEHPAVLRAAQALERSGVEVSRLPVAADGQLDLDDLRRVLRPDTALVSLMHANNETGVLFPIAEAAQLCRERGVLLHSDAAQSLGRAPVSAASLGADLLSISGHKFSGPKGVGALYLRHGTGLRPVLEGGSQERGLRGGTENVAGILGLARAVELAQEEQAAEAERLGALRDRLEAGLVAAGGVVRNGHAVERLANTSSLAFLGIEAESLLVALDLQGIAASAGAACASGSLDPSHVLTAMGLPAERVRGSVRFSLGHATRPEEIERALAVLHPIVARMRRLRPLLAGAPA